MDLRWPQGVPVVPYKLLSHADRMRALRPKPPDDRPSPARRGYDARWRRMRRMVLARQPVCATPDCHRPSKDVHHIKALVHGGEDSFENLQGLCHECHSRITATEHGGFGNRKG